MSSITRSESREANLFSSNIPETDAPAFWDVETNMRGKAKVESLRMLVLWENLEAGQKLGNPAFDQDSARWRAPGCDQPL